jgi:ubiquinone biosynthesis protein
MIKKRIQREVRGALGLARFGMTVSFKSLAGVLPAGYAQIGKKRTLSKLPHGIVGEVLTNALQSSGPVFIKLGQIMATRRDIFSEEICEELERLYSKQDRLPKKFIDKILKKKFGRRPPFKNISKEALSVGSIGAVFTAETKDGEAVVLKILRPNVEKDVARDMDVLRLMLRIGLMVNPRWRPMKSILRRSLDGLGRAFESELDLKLESAALAEFRSKMSKNSAVYFPKPYLEYSDEHILVMEKIDGIPLNEWRRSTSTTEEKRKMAESALQEVLRQVFYDGRYHGDPHAGNILVTAEGKLAFIDFGLVGEFSEADRGRIVKAMKAFISRDADKVVSALLEFGEVPTDFDIQKFKADVATVVVSHKDRVAAQLLGKGENEGEALEKLVSELFATSDRHGIYVPSEVSVLIKALVTIEGVARSLDPDLNVVRVATPVLLSALTPRWIRGISQLWKK